MDAHAWPTPYEQHDSWVADVAQGPRCNCPAEARGEWDCLDCPVHGDDAAAWLAAEQRAEIAAENAWLRAAEAPTADDIAFERYEIEMGLYL